MSIVTPRKGYKSVPWLFGKEIEIPEEWNSFSIKDSGIEVLDGDRGDEYPKNDDFLSQIQKTHR